MLKIVPSRLGPAIALSVAVALAACAQPSDAVTTKRTPTTKARRVAKRTVPPRTTTTIKKTAPTTKVTSTALAPSTLVRAGYEAYLTADVAAARNPEKASTLLPLGMTGADARDPSPRCEGRRLLGRNSQGHSQRTNDRSCRRYDRNVAGLSKCRRVLRQKATGDVVAGTTEPDVDDIRVTLVRLDGKWVVTATERFNDVEGRSRCKPGAPPSS